jgi:hypothetical protein
MTLFATRDLFLAHVKKTAQTCQIWTVFGYLNRSYHALLAAIYHIFGTVSNLIKTPGV